MNQEYLNELSRNTIGACIEVHKALGPGLLENVYQHCVCQELDLRGISYKKEVDIIIQYKGSIIKSQLRADLIVEDQIIVEFKSVNELVPIHEAQLLTYLKLMNKRLGLLINFNVPLLKDGIKRMVNPNYVEIKTS
ncbi:MAG: GxxExxY protein [Candidatus Syntrophosphaera sp.]